MKQQYHLILHVITLLTSMVFLSHTYHEVISALFKQRYILFILLGIAPTIIFLYSFFIVFGLIKKQDEFYKKHKFLVNTSSVGTIVIILSLIFIVLSLFFIKGESAIGIVFLAYFVLASEFIIIFILSIISHVFDK